MRRSDEQGEQQGGQARDRLLDGRQVLVVGGSSGIGRAVAAAARDAGAVVTIAGRSADRLAQAATALGGGVRTARVDLGDPAASAALPDAVPAPDHLVITGGGLAGGLLATLEPGVVEAAWRERVSGPLALVRAVVARRASGDSGASGAPTPLTSVTLTSGLLATRPAPGAALVAALCAAVEALTAALALELAPTRVNALAPGYTDTPLLDDAARAFGAESRAALVTGATARLPVPRAGTAAELAAGVLFAMTNGYLTGATLRIDGGARWA